jgi:hypothetical protein
MKTKKFNNELVQKPLALNEEEKLELLLLQRLRSKTEIEFEIVDIREDLAKRIEKGRSHM